GPWSCSRVDERRRRFRAGPLPFPEHDRYLGPGVSFARRTDFGRSDAGKTRATPGACALAEVTERTICSTDGLIQLMSSVWGATPSGTVRRTRGIEIAHSRGLRSGRPRYRSLRPRNTRWRVHRI